MVDLRFDVRSLLEDDQFPVPAWLEVLGRRNWFLTQYRWVGDITVVVGTEEEKKKLDREVSGFAVAQWTGEIRVVVEEKE